LLESLNEDVEGVLDNEVYTLMTELGMYDQLFSATLGQKIP